MTDDMTMTGIVLGTPGYLAPERRAGQSGHRAVRPVRGRRGHGGGTDRATPRSRQCPDREARTALARRRRRAHWPRIRGNASRRRTRCCSRCGSVRPGPVRHHGHRRPPPSAVPRPNGTPPPPCDRSVSPAACPAPPVDAVGSTTPSALASGPSSPSWPSPPPSSCCWTPSPADGSGRLHCEASRPDPRTQALTRPIDDTIDRDPESAAITSLATSLANGGLPGDGALASALQATAAAPPGAARAVLAPSRRSLSPPCCSTGAASRPGSIEDVVERPAADGRHRDDDDDQSLGRSVPGAVQPSPWSWARGRCGESGVGTRAGAITPAPDVDGGGHYAAPLRQKRG